MKFEDLVNQINDWPGRKPFIEWVGGVDGVKAYDNKTSATLEPPYSAGVIDFALVEVEAGGGLTASVALYVTDIYVGNSDDYTKPYKVKGGERPMLVGSLVEADDTYSGESGIGVDQDNDFPLIQKAVEEAMGVKIGEEISFTKDFVLAAIERGVMHPERKLGLMPGEDFDYRNEGAVRGAVEIFSNRRSAETIPPTETIQSGHVLGHEITDDDVEKMVSSIVSQ